MSVSVIIPTLNEEACISNVLKSIPRDVVNEVLVVDGHSTDNTVKIVEEAGGRVILQEGKGYGMAMATGIKYARGDVLIPFDADGSYEEKDIPKLLATLDKGYDVVFASRYHPQSGSDDDTWLRYMGNKFFTGLMRWRHGVCISDSLFLYVAARRYVFEQINMTSGHFDYCIEFPIKVHRAGFKYTEIPSFEKRRLAGDSKVHAFRDGWQILWALMK